MSISPITEKPPRGLRDKECLDSESNEFVASPPSCPRKRASKSSLLLISRAALRRPFDNSLQAFDNDFFVFRKIARDHGKLEMRKDRGVAFALEQELK
jgi:hypothetical protein